MVWRRCLPRFVWLAGYGLFAVILLICNVRLYAPVPPAGEVAPEVDDHLRYLRRRLEGGAGSDMQTLFPEGYFFSYALYGLTWVDVGLPAPAGSPERERALAEARWALQHLDGPAGRAVFP
ncbi:MAG: hypothetical protein L0322_13280, partial [Chloroflexi bacterium]|nr:hypothetical protein [Chloroflexota bacterium]